MESIVGADAPKTPAPPPYSLHHWAQSLQGARFVAYPNTVNLTEAILEFPSPTRDMEG